MTSRRKGGAFAAPCLQPRNLVPVGFAIGTPQFGFRNTPAGAAVPSRRGWPRDRLAEAPLATAWARHGGRRGGQRVAARRFLSTPPSMKCDARLERLRAR